MVWKEIFILIGGVIVGGLIVYFRERFVLTHEYKLKTVNDRIEEFVKDSKKYFGPVATASAELSKALSKDEILKQKEIPFYYLAGYIYQRHVLRENTYLYFPNKVQEKEVVNKFEILDVAIAEMYKYNKRSIVKIVSYYASNKEYNAFCDELSVVTDEFEIFKNKINEEVFRNELREASEDLSSSVFAAIDAAYKPWYDQQKKPFQRV